MAEDNTNRRGLSRSEAQALCNRALSLSRADLARVNLSSGWREYTRVATNRITSAGGAEDVSLRITSIYGKRVASMDTNRLDKSSLVEAVRKSEQLARLAPENPEYLPKLGLQSYLEVEGYDTETGELAAEARAEASALGIQAAKGAGQVAAGYIDVRANANAIATSNGLFAYHAQTGVASTLTARAPDGVSSGWAGDEASA